MGLLVISYTLVSTRRRIALSLRSPLLGYIFSKKQPAPPRGSKDALLEHTETLPPTQRVLFCDELLRRIIGYLYEINERGTLDWESKDALASLAATCTSISGPSLDVLWRYLDDVDGLTHLLQDEQLEIIDVSLQYLYFLE